MPTNDWMSAKSNVSGGRSVERNIEVPSYLRTIFSPTEGEMAMRLRCLIVLATG